MELIKVLTVVVYFATFSEKTIGTSTRKYTSCWDGELGSLYEGTMSVSEDPLPCLKWSDVGSHTDTDFIDGSVAKAENYCRSPDHDNAAPWCYTAGPTQSTCNITVCNNLPCKAGGFGGYVDEVELEDLNKTVDTDTQQLIILEDDKYKVKCCGTIGEWWIWVRFSAKIAFQVWTLNDGSGKYVLKGKNERVLTNGQEGRYLRYIVAPGERISVNEGDNVGFYFGRKPVVPYDTSTSGMGNKLWISSSISIGGTVTPTNAVDIGDREYAFGFKYHPNLPPRFADTMPSEISISESTGRTSVFTISVTDDDHQDIDSLQVTMHNLSSVFSLDSSWNIKTRKKAPQPVGDYPFEFTVVDRCGDYDKMIFTVRVIKDPVGFKNLPGFGTVEESIPTEQNIIEITFTSTGSHCCTVESYVPPIPATNPYTVKNCVRLYLIDGHGVKYNETTYHDVTVNCTDGYTSATGVVKVDIMPNLSPVFDSWNASVTIYANETGNGVKVHTVTVTDTDPITFTIDSMDPASCPFDINSNGEIITTEDLYLYNETLCKVWISASDGTNTVQAPSQLSIIIKDVNEKPYFTNVMPISVLENTPKETSIFKMLVHDGNPYDDIRFSAVFTPADCGSYFYLKPGDGEIKTLIDIDYEAVPVAARTCTLTAIANDNTVNSDPGIYTITIVNVPEPPALSKNVYSYSTEEVNVDTDFNPGIICTDPEDGTAITLGSLDCGSDTKYLTLVSPTQMTLSKINLDGDGLNVPSKIINCSFICSDSDSQTVQGSIEVEVTDANDNMPMFSQGSFDKDIDNYQPIGFLLNVAATDNDITSPNNLVVYSLSGTGADKFAISATGDISLVDDLSAIAASTDYVLTATAEDQGTPKQTNSVVVTIRVTKVITTTTTTTTTTATTPGPTAATLGSSGSSGSGEEGGWLDGTVNKVWLAIAIAVLLCLLAALAYLIYYCCCVKKLAGARLTDFKSQKNAVGSNEANKTPVQPQSESRPDKTKVHYNKSNGHVSMISLEDGRPSSGDSGIPVTPTSQTSTSPPSYRSVTGISVHASDENLSQNVSNSYYGTDHVNFREWMYDQNQYRSAYQAGRYNQ